MPARSHAKEQLQFEDNGKSLEDLSGNAWFGLIFRKIPLATVEGTGLRVGRRVKMMWQ